MKEPEKGEQELHSDQLPVGSTATSPRPAGRRRRHGVAGVVGIGRHHGVLDFAAESLVQHRLRERDVWKVSGVQNEQEPTEGETHRQGH